LIEYCVAEHASDAGIYVGQTEQAIVRYNRASQNVGGIQIENTIGADVYENELTGNTAGLLVFSLPGLTIVNGQQTRLYRNKVYDNNHENFATAATISFMPPGIGVIVQANDNVEIFDNDIRGNNTANCAVVVYAEQKGKAPKEFDIYPEGIYIHDNKFADGGTNPTGPHAELFRSVQSGPIPDIVWDGLTDPNKMVDGKLPDELGLRISNNGDATFVNLNMSTVLGGGEPELITDMSLYEGKFDSLPAVNFPGVE
jgi:parallel beta-helix repeat protein